MPQFGAPPSLDSTAEFLPLSITVLSIILQYYPIEEHRREMIMDDNKKRGVPFYTNSRSITILDITQPI